MEAGRLAGHLHSHRHSSRNTPVLTRLALFFLPSDSCRHVTGIKVNNKHPGFWKPVNLLLAVDEPIADGDMHHRGLSVFQQSHLPIVEALYGLQRTRRRGWLL